MKTKRKLFIAFVIVLLIVISGLAIYLAWRSTPISSTTHTASTYTKGEATAKGISPTGNSSSTDPTTPQNSQVGDQKSNTGSSTGAITLSTPSGDFVSNHHPNLSGAPAPNTISSVCTTTPGAACKIVFTNGTATKSLASETTDRGGSAYWTWKLQDIGLTSGNWKIQAVATLNQQTQTAPDALELVVAQ